MKHIRERVCLIFFLPINDNHLVEVILLGQFVFLLAWFANITCDLEISIVPEGESNRVQIEYAVWGTGEGRGKTAWNGTQNWAHCHSISVG